MIRRICLTWTLAATLILVINISACNATTKGGTQKNDADLEELLLATPDPERLRSVLRTLTQHSHVAGTKGDWDNAYYVQAQLRQNYGFDDVQVEGVQVMMTYPVERPQLSTSFGFHAKLSEDALNNDKTSGTTEWRNHTFLAYSPSGKVTAPLVYANYGRPEDFDALDQMGISVTGMIVIMRYGECFRGLKVMNAEERGAIGSIIYSDPQQDGFTRGPTFDEGGPWRPPSGVQRGSVQHISKCAGDPWRLYQNESTVKAICGYKTENMIPKHVALPLSYEDAKPLLERLGGASGPKGFQGGLLFNYTVGPSYYDVTMQTNHSFHPRKIPNVIATMYADGYNKTSSKEDSIPSIILGNHRDAWVFGAVDPNSGTTSLLEVGRTLGVLRHQGGWKPKRNIILASWSGEEYGLLGSTAYAEMNSENDVVAYLNVDCAVTGNVSLKVSATHSLNTLFRQAAERVPAPPQPPSSFGNATTESNRSMADAWNQEVETLGSGSDYTVFLDRFGVSSLDMTFEGSYGVYHSVYDSMDWMEQEGDPTFETHQAMTRLWALMAFRLASKEILPIYVIPQAVQVRRDVAALDISISESFGDELAVPMHLLEIAGQQLLGAARMIEKERVFYEKQADFEKTEKDRSSLNRRLAFAERQFLGPGLPKRPWFRHTLQAPGFFLGYGSQAFPGVAQAIYDNDADLAKTEITIANNALLSAAKYLLNPDMNDFDLGEFNENEHER